MRVGNTSESDGKSFFRKGDSDSQANRLQISTERKGACGVKQDPAGAIRRKRLRNVRKCKKNAQHVGNVATLCTKLRRRRTKSKGKSETSRDRGSRFLKMLIHEMQFLKDRPPPAKAERKGGNRRLRKMNGVGWLQKSADCGKIDTYGASQGCFRCKSGRECHAGGRFHVLVLHECRRFRTPCVLFHRTPTVSRATRVLFTSNGGDFTHCARFCNVTDDFARHALLHRTPTVSHATSPLHRTAVILRTAHAFASLGDDFARHARFYIARRRFRVLRVCFLHHSPTVSRATRVLFTSLADGFARYASFYIARRRFRTPCALLHRSSTDSRATRVLFTSNGDDFTHCARFCIVTDDFVRHAFTSLAGGFARHALFYIARRRFRVLRVCFLHRTAVISHTARAFASSLMISCAMRPFTSSADDFTRHAVLLHRTPTVSRATRVLFTSHGGDFTHCARFCIVTDDFARHASFCIARRRIFTLCVLLHRPAMISHSVHVLFISPADDFARRACSYTKGREKHDFKGSDF